MTKRPTLHIFDSAEALSREAINTIATTLAAKPQAVFLFPTGKTPIRLYELLLQKVRSKTIQLKDAKIFLLDEYYSGQDYRHYIEERLLTPLDPAQRPTVYVLNGLTEHIEEEASQFEKNLQAFGIDLAILGVNAHGHIGFNEPGSPFDSKTRLVQLTPETIFNNRNLMERVKAGGEPYTQALTVGISTILAARQILLLASGPEKAAPINHLMTGRPDPKIPVTALLLRPQNVTVLVDRKAAGSLEVPPKIN